MEKDDFCVSVIEARMADKLVPSAPVFRDVVDFVPNKDLAAATEGLIGGFPCQAACRVPSVGLSLCLCVCVSVRWTLCLT